MDFLGRQDYIHAVKSEQKYLNQTKKILKTNNKIVFNYLHTFYCLVFLVTIAPYTIVCWGIELRNCILVSLHTAQWSQRISEVELKYLFAVILLENILWNQKDTCEQKYRRTKIFFKKIYYSPQKNSITLEVEEETKFCQI